jgi:hypothetical protein
MLRVLGDCFSPENFLATARLPVSPRFTKGEQTDHRRRPSSTGGFNCEISSNAATLREQAKDSLTFLEHYYDDLACASTMPTVESSFSDFEYDLRPNGADVTVQRDSLPP